MPQCRRVTKEQEKMAPSRGGIIIFSGGSAANSLVDIFEAVRKSKGCPLSYIIPISDNGGSSSELIRVFGGPGIGDVRSRLVRLIPIHPYSREREAIGTLLSSRLSSTDSRDARNSWSEIVDGTSSLWKGISSAKKELIRSFFNLVNLEILKRSRPPTSTFDFRSASVGNLFLTGARLFSGSFESAIYLLSAVCGIPDDDIKVIPSINSNFSHHIAAELEDGTVIVGQNSISHPSLLGKQSNNVNGPGYVNRMAMAHNGGTGACMDNFDDPASTLRDTADADDSLLTNEEEDAHPPFTLPTLRSSNITFTKTAEELDELPSRIRRIHYVNSFGQEILPPANPRALQALQNAEAIIFSIGSLYTSIVPNLVLRGVGDTMRKSHATTKILILNGCLDREVGPDSREKPFTAADFVNAIVKAGEQSRGVEWSPRYMRYGEQQVDDAGPVGIIQDMSHRPNLQRANTEGYTMIISSQTGRLKALPPPMLASNMPSRSASPATSPERSTPPQLSTNASRGSSSKPTRIYKNYVTHLIHLPNSTDTPYVEQDLLQSQYGIKCIRVYGRRNASGPGMLYDPQALKGAIEAVLGGRGQEHVSVDDDGATGGSKARLQDRERGRRNTVEN